MRNAFARGGTFTGIGIVCLVLAACGGAHDNSGATGGPVASFAGIWNGTMTSSSRGLRIGAPEPASLILVQIDDTTLEVAGFCGDGSGPRARASGTSTLSLVAATCPAVSVSGCSSVSLAIRSGSGTLAGDTLTLSFDATASGCSQSFDYVFDFTGSRGLAEKPTAVVTAPSASQVQVGSTVTLDGSGSFDALGRPLSYSWWLQAPAGSAAAISGSTTARATFTADKAGTYVANLIVTAGGQASDVARATIVASATALPPPPPGQGDTATLSFRPLATRYDRALDRLVFISDGPARLHLYDPVAQTDVQIALPLTPTCLTLSSDGQFAAVGHDAWLSYVDLGAQAVVSTWPISATAGDVVLGDPVSIVDPATQIARATRFAYVFPSSDQWVAIHNLDLGNGAEKLSESIYAGMRAVLQPGTNHIFGVTANLSPAQIYRFDLDPATGVAGGNVQSPYWGDHPMGWPLWSSSDGLQLLTGSGTRFRTQDLTYAGSVALPASTTGGYQGVGWADFSPDGAHWLIQPSASDTSLVTVDSQFLASPAEVAYPPFIHANGSYPLHGKWVFYDGSGARKIVVAQADAAANALFDFTVLVE